MAIKKVLLKKKIEGVIYDLYVKSSADIVAFSDSQSVAEKITDMVGILDGLTTGDNSVDKKIAAAKTEVINQIMGATDGEQIAQAFDTIKEIADYLDGHGSVVQGFTNDIAALKAAVGDAQSGLVKDVATLKATVGDASNGLVKDVAANKAAIGDANSGLTKGVADNAAAIKALQDVGSVKVEKSDVNGNIKINGTETKVYDDSAIAATKIVEDTTHRFTTDTEKAAWNAKTDVVVASQVPETVNDTDLLFIEI